LQHAPACGEVLDEFIQVPRRTAKKDHSESRAEIVIAGAAVTLCALHFISCSISLTVMRMLGITQSSGKFIPWAGVTATNIHLQVMHVGCKRV
jgi:hypothetical protein